MRFSWKIDFNDFTPLFHHIIFYLPIYIQKIKSFHPLSIILKNEVVKVKFHKIMIANLFIYFIIFLILKFLKKIREIQQDVTYNQLFILIFQIDLLCFFFYCLKSAKKLISFNLNFISLIILLLRIVKRKLFLKEIKRKYRLKGLRL